MQATAHNFGSAGPDEKAVFGASRPGYPSLAVSEQEVDDWIAFVKEQGIKRVVCLLDDSQLGYYGALPGGLMTRYNEAFGPDNVLNAPIQDFHLSTVENLARIMAFLDESKAMNSPTVIHCSGGVGRTGHVLAAWLVHRNGAAATEAIGTVLGTEANRNPSEVVALNGFSPRSLEALLESVRRSSREAS